ncbi:hypothetical protein F4680DRAFT_422919 [Xylaria scruposa]|nr:hypothetical protein F4680DRAFT_422919 [Xylaria scruposa]
MQHRSFVIVFALFMLDGCVCFCRFYLSRLFFKTFLFLIQVGSWTESRRDNKWWSGIGWTALRLLSRVRCGVMQMRMCVLLESSQG